MCAQNSPEAVPEGRAAAPTQRPGTAHRFRSASRAQRKMSLSPSENANHFVLISIINNKKKKKKTHKVMILKHILDQQKHIQMPLLIHKHLPRLHLPFIPTFHPHNRPNWIIRRRLPVIRGGPYTQSLIVGCIKHVRRVPGRDRVGIDIEDMLPWTLDDGDGFQVVGLGFALVPRLALGFDQAGTQLGEFGTDRVIGVGCFGWEMVLPRWCQLTRDSTRTKTLAISTGNSLPKLLNICKLHFTLCNVSAFPATVTIPLPFPYFSCSLLFNTPSI